MKELREQYETETVFNWGVIIDGVHYFNESYGKWLEEKASRDSRILSEVARIKFMKIRELEWMKPDVNQLDECGGPLAWKAQPTPKIKFMVTECDSKENSFESWYFHEDGDDDYQYHDTIPEAKKWCEEHWAFHAKEQILLYAEIEEGDLA